MRGGAHATEDDHLLLAALEAVDRRDLHSGGVAAAAAAAAAAAQPMAQQAHLRGVGEMKRRCSGDEGEIYKGDDGEI